MIEPGERIIITLANKRHKDSLPEPEEVSNRCEEEISEALRCYKVRDFPGSIFHGMFASFMAVSNDMSEQVFEDVLVDEETRSCVCVFDISDMELAATTMAEEMLVEDTWNAVVRRMRENIFFTVGINEALQMYAFSAFDSAKDLLLFEGVNSENGKKIADISTRMAELHKEIWERNKKTIHPERYAQARISIEKSEGEDNYPSVISIAIADTLLSASLGEVPTDELEKMVVLEDELREVLESNSKE